MALTVVRKYFMETNKYLINNLFLCLFSVQPLAQTSLRCPLYHLGSVAKAEGQSQV